MNVLNLHKRLLPIVSVCLLATCGEREPSASDSESTHRQGDPSPTFELPAEAHEWISDVERREKLPPDEYRKQQDERRRKMEEAIADISDVPLPPEAHDIGMLTCRIDPAMLRDFYQRLHDSIDFNSARWMIGLDNKLRAA